MGGWGGLGAVPGNVAQDGCRSVYHSTLPLFTRPPLRLTVLVDPSPPIFTKMLPQHRIGGFKKKMCYDVDVIASFFVVAIFLPGLQASVLNSAV